MLLNKNIVFSVSNETASNEITVNVYKDNNKNCNITDSAEHSIEIEQCEKTQQPELGLYKCSQKFDMDEFSADTADADKLYHLSIVCNDVQQIQNINENSYQYILKQSKPLQIIDYEPKEEVIKNIAEINVVTSKSKDIRCNIRKELALSGEQMKKEATDKFSYTAKLSKGYTVFSVSCEDAFGNSAEKDIGILFANSPRSFSK